MSKLKNKFDKLIVGIFAIMLIATAVLRIMQYVADHKKVLITLEGKTIVAEIAETPVRQAQGLSDRKFLEANAGMLFLFKQPAILTFWMQGMKFPLDFIWIKGKEVRDISPHVPADYPGFLHPREEVDKVLEVNEGVIDRYNIRIGNTLVIDNN